jgi:hypothetical protein
MVSVHLCRLKKARAGFHVRPLTLVVPDVGALPADCVSNAPRPIFLGLPFSLSFTGLLRAEGCVGADAR